MNNLPEPTNIIELDIPSVARQGLYLTGFALIILLPLHVLLNHPIKFSISLLSLFLFIIGYIGLIILHEFFHLLGFRVFSNVPWKRMKVGVDFKMGTAYATTDKLMTNKAIRKSLLLPFWLTGILPAIIGLYLNSGILVTVSALLIGGAAGDFSMYKQLKRYPNHWLIQDDPQLPRLYLHNPDNVKKACMSASAHSYKLFYYTLKRNKITSPS